MIDCLHGPGGGVGGVGVGVGVSEFSLMRWRDLQGCLFVPFNLNPCVWIDW